MVNAVDAAGATTTLGTVAIATFANPAGLIKVGDSSSQATPNSGAASIGAPSTGRAWFASPLATSRCPTSTWPRS